MATPTKCKRDESCNGEEQVGVSFSSVYREWTPARRQRATVNRKKVRSADDGPLMGGDWVLNEQGLGATLSFCFENSEGTECFGLTVGHLAASVGDSIFRFAESKPVPVPDTEKEKEVYFMFEIGTVTSISTKTDSLVFKLDLEKGNYHPMSIALSSQSHATVSKDLISLAETPKVNDRVVGFGAQRRGAMCVVKHPSLSSPGEFPVAGDIRIMNASEPAEAMADGGDCGTIFFSTESGAPIYFHHVLLEYSDGTKISCGVPLLKILNSHEETRHLVPTCYGDRKNELKEEKTMSSTSHHGEAYEVAG